MAMATELQTRVNRKGVEDLRMYHEAFSAFQQRRRRGGENGGVTAECGRLLSTLRKLVEEEATGVRYKIVDLLLVSCYAARLMNGARTTSCKSAKDRTSMFQSLESVRWAQRQGVLSGGGATHQQQEAEEGLRAGSGSTAGVDEESVLLELLRGAGGVRLKNCGDNIGKDLYTFNSLQLTQLPLELRPMAGVSGAGVS